MKTKISKIGRRGKIVLAILIAGMFIGVATAALMPHFGKLTTTATMSQAVLVDGKSMPESGDITESISGVTCNTVLGNVHWLTNNADKKVIVDLVPTLTSWPDNCWDGLESAYPEYRLDARIDDDAFYVALDSDILWGDFNSASFDYLIDSDGGNLWIPQMNTVLRDSEEGVGQYYACWHSFRTNIFGTVGARTSIAYEKGDFYIYELPSWHLLGLWSDSQWYAEYTTNPGDLGDMYRTVYQTNQLKADVDNYQFNYFTRQAGDTSIDPNPIGAQQIVWLSNFAMDPVTTIKGIGLLDKPSSDPAQRNTEFRMLYVFACMAYEGDYTIVTKVNYIGTL